MDTGVVKCNDEMIFFYKIIIIIILSIVFILHFSWYSAALHKMHIEIQNTIKIQNKKTKEEEVLN